MVRYMLVPLLVALAGHFLAMTQGQEMAELPERPTRPEKFHSQEQVTKYLKQLQAFYGVNGRGRYGKRWTVDPAPEIPAYRQVELMPAPDRSDVNIIDLLRRYAYE